jgi:hypothetical protein
LCAQILLELPAEHRLDVGLVIHHKNWNAVL